jgi:hypothetical protein
MMLVRHRSDYQTRLVEHHLAQQEQNMRELPPQPENLEEVTMSFNKLEHSGRDDLRSSEDFTGLNTLNLTDLCSLVTNCPPLEAQNVIAKAMVLISTDKVTRAVLADDIGASEPAAGPSGKLQFTDTTLTLHAVLSLLSADADSQILTVRRIHKLGFESAQVLRAHFSSFGVVDKILLLPSRRKITSGRGTGCARTRPSSMGFVVMKDVASVDMALLERLSEDNTHNVCGFKLVVQKFERSTTFNVSQDSFFDTSGVVSSSVHSNVNCASPQSVSVCSRTSSRVSTAVSF